MDMASISIPQSPGGLRPLRKNGDSIHVYGGRAAICFELGLSPERAPAIHLQAAARDARNYDWDNKIQVMLKQDEAIEMLGCLIGAIPATQGRYHGASKNKGYSLSAEGSAFTASVSAGGAGCHAVSISRAQAVLIAGMVLRYLCRMEPELTQSDWVQLVRLILPPSTPVDPDSAGNDGSIAAAFPSRRA